MTLPLILDFKLTGFLDRAMSDRSFVNWLESIVVSAAAFLDDEKTVKLEFAKVALHGIDRDAEIFAQAFLRWETSQFALVMQEYGTEAERDCGEAAV